MEINLKEKLRTLRQRKNVTQEALANHLGITPQSVGKWERGEGFPDITLLPKIAFYFDVTVDELLCVDRLKIEETINEYQNQSRIYQQTGENEKLLELWEKAYDKFPNDLTVMENLMQAINRDAVYPCPKDKADRIIELGEKILERSTDSFQRENTIALLCYTYCGIDEEKALHYANISGTIYVGRETLATHVLSGEEGVKACQSYIATCVFHAAMTASMMTSKKQFTPTEVIEAYTFAIDILKLLYSDGNVGFYAHELSYYYMQIARQYVKLQNKEKVLIALKECCKHAVTEANLKDMDYTAPMVNRLKHRVSNTSKNYKGNDCNLRLKALEEDIFDTVRDTEEFKNLVSQMEKYAE